MKWFQPYPRSAICIAVILLCSFPVFYRLDVLPVRQWDEARNAVSAVEMLQNRNYIVLHVNWKFVSSDTGVTNEA